MYGQGTYGDFEYGGFDPADALSTPNVLDTLLKNPHIARSWLVRALPRDPTTSTIPITTINVDLSTDGHRSHPDDLWVTNAGDKALQFEAAIITPYSLTHELADELFGHADTSFGEIVISNARGNRTPLTGLDWVGRQIETYLGPRGGTQLEFSRVARLLSRNVHHSRSTISLITDGFDFVFDNPLQNNFYGGTGGLDGGVEIAGTPIPILLGTKRQVTPILVDGVNFIYQFNDGSFESIGGLEDRGIGLAFNADVADITLASPPAGTFNTSLATGYVRLNTKPAGKLTATVIEGDNGTVYGFVNTITDIIKWLTVTRAGLVDPDELDPTAFNELSTHTVTMGEYFVKPTTIRKAMNVFHGSAYSWSELLPRKVLSVGRITDPDASVANFVLDVDQADVRLLPWKMQPFETVVYRVIVGYRRYSTTMNDSELDAAVSADVRLDYAREYRFATEEDLTVLGQTPEAKEIVILTDLDLETDARELAIEQLSFRKVARRLGTVSARTGLIARSVGNVFELVDDRVHDSPKQFVIVGVQNKAAMAGSADVITFTAIG